MDKANLKNPKIMYFCESAIDKETIDPRAAEIYEEMDKALDGAKFKDRAAIINSICEKYKISKRDLIIYEKYHYPPKFLIQKPND